MKIGAIREGKPLKCGLASSNFFFDEAGLKVSAVVIFVNFGYNSKCSNLLSGRAHIFMIIWRLAISVLYIWTLNLCMDCVVGLWERINFSKFRCPIGLFLVTDLTWCCVTVGGQFSGVTVDYAEPFPSVWEQFVLGLCRILLVTLARFIRDVAIPLVFVQTVVVIVSLLFWGSALVWPSFS